MTKYVIYLCEHTSREWQVTVEANSVEEVKQRLRDGDIVIAESPTCEIIEEDSVDELIGIYPLRNQDESVAK
jgi:hypothetical protein